MTSCPFYQSVIAQARGGEIKNRKMTTANGWIKQQMKL
jgi:hypothetical protein